MQMRDAALNDDEPWGCMQPATYAMGAVDCPFPLLAFMMLDVGLSFMTGFGET